MDTHTDILQIAGRTSYDRSIFELPEVRASILRSFNEDQALALINRFQLAAWTVFRGRKYIVFTEVSPLLGMARSTPKTYLSTHKDEMKQSGAVVLMGSDLKAFFEATGKRSLIAGAHVSSLSVYTPESILLMAMIAKKIERCRQIQRRIAQHLGLIPCQQDILTAEEPQEQASEAGAVSSAGETASDRTVPKPLFTVLEEDGLLNDDDDIPNLANILDEMKEVKEILEAPPQGTVTVPLHEGLSASTFLQEVTGEDVIDFFRKYETYLAEGTQGIIYCGSYTSNAGLAAEIIRQAGHKFQIAAIQKE